MKKKYKKNKNFNKNQTSFYFEDYLESNKKDKYFKENNFFQDRLYLLFFLFFSLILIFSIRILHVSLYDLELYDQNNISKKFNLLRRDIVDRNGVLVSRNVKSFHAAINPKLINNKENFLIKSVGKINFWLLLVAYRNFADREGLFFLISFLDGFKALCE